MKTLNKNEMVSIITDACLEGDHLKLKKLFSEYPLEVFSTRGRDGMSFIHRLAHSAGANPVECLKVFIEGGVSVDLRDYLGETPLIHASDTGREDIVDILLANKAQINLANANGDTAMIKATDRLWFNIMVKLATNGANLSHRNKQGNTAQSICLSKENTDKVAREFLNMMGQFELNKVMNELKQDGANPESGQSNEAPKEVTRVRTRSI